MRKQGLWLVLLVVAGCRPTGPIDKVYPRSKPDPWVLTCLDPSAKTPALLWNGLIGLRVGRDGTGAFVEGRNASFFSIRSYQTSGEEKIVPLPNPLVGSWRVNGEPLDPLRGEGYSQSLDMRTGILRTQWTQNLGDAKASVLCQVAVHPTEAVVAQSWRLSALPAGTVEYRTPRWAPGEAPRGRSGESTWSLIGSDETDFDPSFTEATDRGEQVWKGVVKEGQTKRMWRLAGYRTKATRADAQSSFEASRAAWAKRWRTDIEIDGPVEDQQAVRSFLFYLRSAIHPQGGMAVSPFGLSSATYNGHVFWDADTWVFPALALVDPAAARAIPGYRLRMFARRRAIGSAGETPAVPARVPARVAARVSPGRGPFPWESSVTGREVGPLAMREEIHISGDVAWMLNQAAALGLADPRAAANVKQAARTYYLERATKTKTPQGTRHELKDVVSPDESHTGDNDLYTNLLAQWCVYRPWANSLDPRFKLPSDAQSYLTYDGDALRSYKQAAAVLAIYPLQMVDDKQARRMMDRFSGKVTKNGPAMSHSVHALIWARLGQSQKAYDTWKKSWADSTNHPLLLFSEKPSKDETYFATGAACCLQTVLYGFAGFRIDYRKDSMAAWSHAMRGGSWLSLKPHLPAAWRSVRLTNFMINGQRLSFAIDARGVKIAQGEP